MDSAAAGGWVLEVHVHHARNIHNICIYADQDVYAKFSLTCSPDDAVATRVVTGGGKNPIFNHSLRVNLPSPDHHDQLLLKCEVWMLSRAPSCMDDQLLGFALVPLRLLNSSSPLLTDDFSLSSTDLFHSPAGTVRLSLSLLQNHSLSASNPITNISSSIASEVLLLDPRDVDFPDVGAATEDGQMVSDYFHMGGVVKPIPPPFLIEDCEMSTAANSSGSASPDIFSSSTMTSLGDERMSNSSGDSMEEKKSPPGADTIETHLEEQRDGGVHQDLGPVFKRNPMESIDIEAEQSAMQQQIVDMYMKSMQQFTESLAKMKLPMDLDGNSKKNVDNGVGEDIVIDGQSSKLQPEKQKKKDGSSRVFYGSRAFF